MKPFRTLAAASLLAAGLAAAAPAGAQQVTAANPKSVASALQALGYQAELTTDSDGDPHIKSGASGVPFRVFFHGCKQGANCDSVAFFLGFTDRDPSAERLNEWNRTKRFGRAYIDAEDDPVVVMDVDLDSGGISRALFGDYVATWSQIVAQFRDWVNE